MLLLMIGCANIVVFVLFGLGLIGVGDFWSPIICVSVGICACVLFCLFGRWYAESRYVKKYREMCRVIERANKYAEQVVQFFSENSSQDGGANEK